MSESYLYNDMEEKLQFWLRNIKERQFSWLYYTDYFSDLYVRIITHV